MTHRTDYCQNPHILGIQDQLHTLDMYIPHLQSVTHAHLSLYTIMAGIDEEHSHRVNLRAKIHTW